MNFIPFLGWHRRLNYKAGRPSLQLYVLLPLLLREGKLVTLQHQLVSESALRRHRRTVYVKMDGEISTYWDLYDDNNITAEDFLKEIGDIYTR